MVVKEDGTKWACQSCLKGHRVSGCNHTDRELTLVPKKGRPVTQCQHCRLERKKRSAHVKCDCGEAEKPHHPKEKCIHLREAEERAKAGFHDDHHIKQEEDPAHLVAVAEEQGCCCHHGGKCSCSLVKKEGQSKGTSPPHGPAVHKPRLETTRSEGSITVFANGHHKPVHRKNHAAHESGMPYRMPLARSNTDHALSEEASRSVDSLPLGGSQMFSVSTLSSHGLSSAFPERRMSKSEQPSPKWGAVSNCTTSEANFSAVDFSNLGSVQTSPFIPASSQDAMTGNVFGPMPGLADGSYDPWSALPSADSLPNNNPFGAWPSTYDTCTQPALTAASSGTQSEIDEIPTMEDLYSLPMPSIQEDAGSFVMDTNMVGGSNINRRSLPPNFFGNADFAMTDMPTDWPTPVGSVHGSEEGKTKGLPTNDSALSNSDAWSTPTIPSMSSIAQRNVGVTSNPGRPQSQSVGPSNAPNDDLIRQLFPDIDVQTSVSGSPMRSATPNSKFMGGLPVSRSTPAIMTISTDDTAGFLPQSWSDGSLSVPNDDAFTAPYSMDGDFSDSNINGDWY